MSRVNAINVKRAVAVFMAVLMTILSLSYTSNKTDAANTKRHYYVYDAKTGSKIDEYDLDPVPSVNNSRAIIGSTDDRWESWNNKEQHEVLGVVKLMNDYDYLGTGFVIDSHTIATAAHCVYDTYYNKICEFKEILCFDKNGNIKLHANPVKIHICKRYIDTESPNYDYALVTVKEDLSDYVKFNLGVPLDYFVDGNSDTTITVTGFPMYIKNNNSGLYEFTNDNNMHIMYSGNGSMYGNIDYFDKEYLVGYDADMTSGNSGGPVYITESIPGYDPYYTVVAINIASPIDTNVKYNIGTRITTDLIQFYMQNPNLK